MNDIASLGVVDETEFLARLLDRDDIHETGRVGEIRADLSKTKNDVNTTRNTPFRRP